MSNLQPVSVALKFGFIAVIYLFLLWISRSALRDLRGSRAARVGADPDATGLYSASTSPVPSANGAVDARLVVARAPGHEAGMIYDLDATEAVLGRGDRADIRLEDPFASSRHARIYAQGGLLVLEDMGSTNGTYLNEELLEGPRPLHRGDRVRIGDSEFTFETK